jgi:hypothetical protein
MRDYYHQQMYRRFPEVQYCDLDWKAEKIASEAYTHWNPPESIAASIKLEADTPSGTNPHLKRARSPMASSKPKRQKKALIQHDTPARTESPPVASVSSTPSAPIVIVSAIPDVSQDLTSPPTEPAKAPLPITDTTHATDQRSPQNIGSIQALEHGVEVGRLWLKEAGNGDDNGGEQTPDMVPTKVSTQFESEHCY